MPRSKKHTDPHSLTPAEIRRLPGPERVPFVERMRIIYPRIQTILDEIRRCDELSPIAAEPPCMMIVGPPGAGKSTLVNLYTQARPAQVTDTRIARPYLTTTIPAPATVGGVVSSILEDLGDPRAESGTREARTKRAKKLLDDCETRMMFFDEIQGFVDRSKGEILYEATDWLKNLIKSPKARTKRAAIFIGLQGQAETVLNVNPQLARLFGDPYVLSPFEWDPTHPETIKEFRTFLGQIEKMLPLREASHLSDRENARRIFLASSGLMGYLMLLLRRAAGDALNGRTEHLTDELLADTFDRYLASERRGIANPFRENPSGANGRHSQTKPAATRAAQSPTCGPRGRVTRGRGRRPRMKDVM